MSNIAIKVEGLGKAYRLGSKDEHDDTFIGAMLNVLKAPLRNFRKLQELNTFESCKTGEDILWALKNVSFNILHGEVVGIIGRNGAGKSTLLKILSRIVEPTEGRVEIRGRVSSLLEVGTGFHQELTGRENVYMNGTILGMRKVEIDRKFDEIVEFSGVERFLDTPVKRYSSGMKVRLAFAVAAHLEPEILIVDEVLAVGDAEFQKKCLGKMQDVAGGGRTVLFVSHQLEALANLCSRAIMIENGTVSASGNVSDVILSYLSLQKNDNIISVRDRKDRKGSGRIKIIDTWIENINSEKCNVVLSGDNIKIVFVYEVYDDKISKFTAGIALNSDRNIQISLLRNEYTADYFNNVLKIGKVECIIECLPLNVGSFFYNISVESTGGLEDWICNAGTFDVQAGDFFGTGKISNKERLLLIKHRWQLSNL